MTKPLHLADVEGAQWLPFQPFATLKAGVNGNGSREVLWARMDGVP